MSPDHVDLMEMCDVKTYLIEDPDPNGHLVLKRWGRARCFRCLQRSPTRFTMLSALRIDEVPNSLPEKVLKPCVRNLKVADPRYGPTSIPSVHWPETLRVLTPAEAAMGRELPRVAGAFVII